MRNSVPPIFLPSQVIVLEDDPAVRGALFAALRLEGCTARTRETRAVGAEEALVDRPGVIVFEYTLPWTDAHAIVEQLRLLMRPAPAMILLTDPTRIAEACSAHGISVMPMNPPKADGVVVGDSSIVRHTRVLTVDCPDRAEEFVRTIAPELPADGSSLPPPSLGSGSGRPSLLVVRQAKSGTRIRAASVAPPTVQPRTSVLGR